MSKTTSFLLACLIYFSAFLLIFLSFRQLESINYGNSSIDVFMVLDDASSADFKSQGLAENDDFTKPENPSTLEPPHDFAVEPKAEKALNEQENQSPKESENPQEMEQSEPASLDDLFANIKIQPQNPTPPQNREVAKAPQNRSNLEPPQNRKEAKAPQNRNHSARAAKGASAQSSGLYDKYFGRINAYLKNVWSLVASNYELLERDEQIVDFFIDAAGYVSIGAFSPNSSNISKAAAEFAKLVNQAKRNFGPPPKSSGFSGKARLGIRFNASIK